MAAKSAAAKNAMLAGYAGVALYASLHATDPGTTGAGEITGGSPAYARQAVTWGTPASGSVATTAAMTFNVPAGQTIAYVGLWSAATGGTFEDGFAITSESYGAQGTYTLTSITETVTS